MWTTSELWGFALDLLGCSTCFAPVLRCYEGLNNKAVATPQLYLHKIYRSLRSWISFSFWNANYYALFFPLDLLSITQLFDHNRTSYALACLHGHSKRGRNKELSPVAHGSGRVIAQMTEGTQALHLIALLGSHGGGQGFSQRQDASAFVTASVLLCMPCKSTYNSLHENSKYKSCPWGHDLALYNDFFIAILLTCNFPYLDWPL